MVNILLKKKAQYEKEKLFLEAKIAVVDEMLEDVATAPVACEVTEEPAIDLASVVNTIENEGE